VPRKINIPAAPGVSVPDVGVDIQDLKRASKKMTRELYMRLIGMIHNELDASADEILEDAKSDLSAFDSNTKTTGLLAQGLYRTKVQAKGGGKSKMFVGFGWTKAYGRVLEFGPSVTEWMIYPKFRKALRWTATNFIGPTQSGIPGEKVMFSKSVRHKDKPEHRRPHLVPAVKRGIKPLEKRLMRGIEREFMRTRV
jgi:hypothetical protein